LDLVAEQRVLDFMRDTKAVLSAATPLARGGLLITLARCCARSGIGAEVWWPDDWRELAKVAGMFGEAQSRFLVALPQERWLAVVERARPLEVPMQELGAAGGVNLTIEGAFNLDLGRMNAWT
jgi:phosphoribosylformylglycinamidine synthase